MTQPVIIISTGRTGTSFFSHIIGKLYPEATAYHQRGFSRPIQIFTNMYFEGLIPKKVLIFTWNSFKAKEITTCEKAFHVDANCFLYGIVSLAPELFSGFKVIHIIRDPRTYVTSHLNYAKFWPTSFVANYFVPFWQPNPFLTRRIPWKKFFSFSRFERYAWIWSFKNEVMESLEQIDIPYLRVRFEDIFNSDTPVDAFYQITDFIGLPRKHDIHGYFSQPVNQAPKNNFPEWPEWTPRLCGQLHSLCGKRMTKYNYGTEAAWQEKLAA